MLKSLRTAISCLTLLISGCSPSAGQTAAPASGTDAGPAPEAKKKEEPVAEANLEKATFGVGCFWCGEAVFQRLKGVKKVVSGYAGGHVPNPTYKQVCTGETGHAEVFQVTYDPAVTTYDELLEVFWKTHDPTTKDQQGNDVGPQYRSVVFYHDDAQKARAEKYKKALEAEKVWPDPIVTEISPLTNFYPAEDYHQNYFNDNPGQPYCKFIIRPKVEKFEKVFKDKLKAKSEK